MMMVALLALFAGAAAGSPPARPHPVIAVVLSRHGVRAPLETSAALARYASEPWPDFGVPPAGLTTHGRELMVIYGAYYRALFAKQGLAMGSGCAAAEHTLFWADTDQRTVETGQALSEGMFPGCKVKVGVSGEKHDPLFRPVEAGVGKVDAQQTVASVRAMIPNELSNDAERYQAAFAAMGRVLGRGDEAWMHGATTITASGTGMASLRGPIQTGGGLAEAFELEYADGMSGERFGWGRLDRRGLNAILPLHFEYVRLMLAAPYEAQARGSNLVDHIRRTLEQAATGQEVAGAVGGVGEKVVFLVGHDTNISSVAVPLGLDWKLAGYPQDDTPLGGAMVFELWQEATGEYSVHIFYTAQSLEQMHDGAKLSLAHPPEEAAVGMRGCAPCSWAKFAELAKAAVDQKFVQ